VRGNNNNNQFAINTLCCTLLIFTPITITTHVALVEDKGV